jgi:hypothetical protein
MLILKFSNLVFKTLNFLKKKLEISICWTFNEAKNY